MVFISYSWFQNQVHAGTIQTVRTPPLNSLKNPNFGPRKDFENFVSFSGPIINMLCCCCICWFCRKKSPGIALNFPQVSSRTPMRKSIFLAGLSGAETLCRCETETVCLRGTETLCLWATKTCVCGQQRPVSLGNRVLCLCGTEKPCLCAEYRIWRRIENYTNRELQN